MKAAVQMLVLAALAVAAEAGLGLGLALPLPEEDTKGVFKVEDSPGLAPVHPFNPESLTPVRPLEGEDEAELAFPQVLSRRLRSTVVFRPLFATRERDAERQKQQERRREYWANEERRRRGGPRPGPSRYPAQYYPAQYYPAGGR